MKKMESKRGTMAVAERVMVVSEAPLATQAGLEELKAGGNAMDAFIATAFAEHVVAQGYISLAGTMGLLYYEAKSGKTYYLDAAFDIPKHGMDGFDPNKDRYSGKSVLIPGIVAGLEAASQKFGRRPWKELLAPALHLAQSGFPLTPLYAWTINNRKPVLVRSDYGKTTFFKDGKPLNAGDSLKQPILAKTLDQIATQGSAYMYRGEWAHEFVRAVRDHGGEISATELEAYHPRWQEPLKASYRKYEVAAAPPPDRGGFDLLLSLKILQHVDLRNLGHWTKSPESLATLVRIYRAVAGRSGTDRMDDPGVVAQQLSDVYAEELWENIRSSGAQPSNPVYPGSHSGHTVVVDQEGNIATGTYTIEALPWGDNGIFVGGIPLNSAAPIAHMAKAHPGGRMREGYAPHIVFEGGRPILAAGTISSSLFPCNLQVLANVLDFEMNLEDALLAPRFGMYSVDLKTYSLDQTTNLLDERFDSSIVSKLASQGLKFDQEGQGGFVDTGMWFGIRIDRKAGKVYGMSSEQADGLAEGW